MEKDLGTLVKKIITVSGIGLSVIGYGCATGSRSTYSGSSTSGSSSGYVSRTERDSSSYGSRESASSSGEGKSGGRTECYRK